MADRSSDLVSIIRQKLTNLDEDLGVLQHRLSELQRRIAAGEFYTAEEWANSGHSDIAYEQFMAAVGAIGSVDRKIEVDERVAIQLIRL